MRQFLASLTIPAIFGFVLTLPFMVMELVNRRELHEPYPVTLFIYLWLLGTAFGYAAQPLLRETPLNLRLALRLGLLLVIAWLWITTVADQMPCFLGVPNCD